MTWWLRALDQVWRMLGWDDPPAAEFARRYRRLHAELQAYVDAQSNATSGGRRGG